MYVFVKRSSGWSSGHEAAKLTASNGAELGLGDSVGVSADGSTVVAAAPYDALLYKLGRPNLWDPDQAVPPRS